MKDFALLFLAQEELVQKTNDQEAVITIEFGNHGMAIVAIWTPRDERINPDRLQRHARQYVHRDQIELSDIALPQAFTALLRKVDNDEPESYTP